MKAFSQADPVWTFDAVDAAAARVERELWMRTRPSVTVGRADFRCAPALEP